MEASCTVQTLRNSCKFFFESDKKKLARAISKNQVSDPRPSWPIQGPSWPSCFFLFFWSSANAFSLGWSKIMLFGEEFKPSIRKVCHILFTKYIGMLHGFVIKCRNHKPWAMGSSLTGISVIFIEIFLDKTLHSPSLVKPRKYVNMCTVVIGQINEVV